MYPVIWLMYTQKFNRNYVYNEAKKNMATKCNVCKTNYANQAIKIQHRLMNPQMFKVTV